MTNAEYWHRCYLAMKRDRDHQMALSNDMNDFINFLAKMSTGNAQAEDPGGVFQSFRPITLVDIRQCAEDLLNRRRVLYNKGHGIATPSTYT